LYSIYTLDEYLFLANEFNQEECVDKTSNLFYEFDKEYAFKNQVLLKPFLKNLQNSGVFYSNSFYADDFITPTKFLSTSDYYFFSLFSAQTALEDSYESLKFLNYLYNFSYKNFISFSSNFFNPYTYSFVFDMFRSDYDDFS
jgi:hypothetical protein